MVERRTYQGADSIRVGLKDGRVLPLSTFGGRTRARLNQNDVIYVKVFESAIREGPNRQQIQGGTRVELRVRPTVQGTTLVLAFFFMMLNLAVDIVQTFVDPRIKRG